MRECTALAEVVFSELFGPSECPHGTPACPRCANRLPAASGSSKKSIYFLLKAFAISAPRGAVERRQRPVHAGAHADQEKL